MLEQEVFFMKKWIGMSVVLILIIALAWNIFGKQKESVYGITNEGTGLEIGDMPPQFTLQNLEGEDVNLEDFKGQKVILNFWATWCEPCREEMPLFEQIDQTNDDVTVLAVNMAPQDSGVEKVQQFMQKQGLTFNVVRDELGDVSKAYKVVNIPSTYFLDEKGNIQSKVLGVVDETSLVEHLKLK